MHPPCLDCPTAQSEAMLDLAADMILVLPPKIPLFSSYGYSSVQVPLSSLLRKDGASSTNSAQWEHGDFWKRELHNNLHSMYTESIFAWESHCHITKKMSMFADLVRCQLDVVHNSVMPVYPEKSVPQMMMYFHSQVILVCKNKTVFTLTLFWMVPVSSALLAHLYDPVLP